MLITLLIRIAGEIQRVGRQVIVLHVVVADSVVSVVKKFEEIALESNLIPDGAYRGGIPNTVGRSRNGPAEEKRIKFRVGDVEKLVLLLVAIQRVIKLKPAPDPILVEQVEICPEIIGR